VVELSLFNALALRAAGRNEHASDVFADCLNLAQQGGYVRLFLEMGEPVRSLLEEAAPGDTRAEYAASLLSALDGARSLEARGAAVPASPPALVEVLTGRELQVLRLICEGCSNQQIATALIVSVNTIKKHTSNIYAKLGVRSRAQAVIRAQEIELI
jgi:LuxR family transcriptional regulator, maltose regulon positive regulatory protein